MARTYARGGSVFIAFLSGLTNTAYTATQYALFTSIMTLPGKVIGGFSGVIVDWLQTSARDVPALAALLDAVGAEPKFDGFAIFFAGVAWSLSFVVLAVIVRRHFEKETPPSARKEGQ